MAKLVEETVVVHNIRAEQHHRYGNTCANRRPSNRPSNSASMCTMHTPHAPARPHDAPVPHTPRMLGLPPVFISFLAHRPFHLLSPLHSFVGNCALLVRSVPRLPTSVTPRHAHATPRQVWVVCSTLLFLTDGDSTRTNAGLPMRPA